jgi:serine/threonine-protein kinase
MPAISELLQEGRYRISSQNGNGSYLHEAVDTSTNQRVLIKELILRTGKVTTLSQQEEIKKAVAEQAKRLIAIRNPRLLSVLDFFGDHGRQYLVLEAFDGDDFATLLEQNSRPFAFSDVLKWGDQLLEGLALLHNQAPPIIHKNIRPKNIKLGIDGNIKLYGFGIADSSDNVTSNSLFDESLDTPVLNYSPLELIWDGLDAASQKVILAGYDDKSEKTLKSPPDPRSDIYSVSATLYHLITGKVPVDPLERSIEILDGKSDPLAPPSQINSTIPPEVSEVLMRGLSIKREDRYDTATIMRQVLKTAMIRVREREEAEQEDLHDAVEILSKSQEQDILVQKQEAEESARKAKEAEEAARKAREAEEQRLAAEKRAAEMERLLREKEAERKRKREAEAAKKNAEEQQPGAQTEDDLLGIITPVNEQAAHAAETTANNVVADSSAPVNSDQLASEFPSAANEPLDTEMLLDVSSSEAKAEVLEAEVEESFVEAYSDSSAVAKAEPVTAEAVQDDHSSVSKIESDDSLAFSSHSASSAYESDIAPKSGFPMAIVAGGVAVIVLIAAIAWFMLSSSTPSQPSSAETKPQPAQQQPQQAEPAPQNAFAPQTETTESPEVKSEKTSAVTESEPAQSRTQAKQNPQAAKQAKPTPEAQAQKPEQKKKVTVDDLINDN